MTMIKGCALAVVAYCAGFVTEFVVEPYLPGPTKQYREMNESILREVTRLNELNQHLERKIEALKPKAIESQPAHNNREEKPDRLGERVVA